MNDDLAGLVRGKLRSLHIRFTEHKQAFRIMYRPRRRAFGRALHRARVKAGMPRTVSKVRRAHQWSTSPFIRLP